VLFPPIQVHSFGAVVCAAADKAIPANASKQTNRAFEAKRLFPFRIGIPPSADPVGSILLVRHFVCDKQFRAGCGVHLRHLVDAPLDDDDLDVDMTGQVEQELEDKQSIGA
jgi:hypothetical protein